MTQKTRMRAACMLVFATAMFLAATGAGIAQTITGSLIGTVKDSQGLGIPGATVVLISESRGIKTSPAITNAGGDFVVVNVPSDTYTVEVTMPGFKTAQRKGVAVSSGDRVSMGTVALEVGGLSESVTVTSEVPLIQAASGERSFTATQNDIDNVPIPTRSFVGMSFLAPGVFQSGIGVTNGQGENASARVGGSSTENNYVMDGSSQMDTGQNRPLISLTTEAIAEVKVLVSGYSAEYGRSSGLQIIGTTKSGTNQFHGGLYDVERSSKWNATNKVDLLNGDPKPVIRQRDLGFSIGGPIGKPGGNNKFFFFTTTDFGPRTLVGNATGGAGDAQAFSRFRVPTARERTGDFSQTRDNNGNLYNFIKDPLLNGACTAASQVACFADGGVLGKIPANRLYAPGMQVLNWYPAANIDPIPASQAFNLEVPGAKQHLVSWQPTVKIDYQPTSSLRVSGKRSQWTQQNKIILGTIPGWNDTTQGRPGARIWSFSVNYSLTNNIFIEANLGINRSDSDGCAFNAGAGGTGAEFCQLGTPVSAVSNKLNYFPGLPAIYETANIIPPGSYTDIYYNKYSVVKARTPYLVDGRLWLPPVMSYGNRVSPAPPNLTQAAGQNRNIANDGTVSLTWVVGRHTAKVGYYHINSLKDSGASSAFQGTLSFAQDTVGTNPFDTSFGFANAAIGSFSSYTQSEFITASAAQFHNKELYVQDSWKMNSRLTLDLGVRFVHQPPAQDLNGRQSQWDPAKWNRALQPRLYFPGCANGVYPCSGTNRQAMDPLTGKFFGPNSSVLIATVIPGTGQLDNGVTLVPADKFTYETPFALASPRLGWAYDVGGNQSVVVRGGWGLFYSRNSTGGIGGSGNPPLSSSQTLRYQQLQSLGAGGLVTVGAPSYSGQEKLKASTSSQWNTDLQVLTRWSTLVSAGVQAVYTYNTPITKNFNTASFGAQFFPENQDRTMAPSAVPGATALPAILYPSNPFPGASSASMAQRDLTSWRTVYTMPLSVSRRLRNGLSFAFNDTITLSDKTSVAPRWEQLPDGSLTVRADQAEAQKLLGNTRGVRQYFKGNFVWQLPEHRSSSTMGHVVDAIINNWQVSAVWTGNTGDRYDVGYSYASNGNVTGGGATARVRILGTPGSGCSSDPLKQFDTSVYAGPLPVSVGLESGNNYLTGCFQSHTDLALARTLKIGNGNKRLSIRADIFNIFNEARIRGVNSTMNLPSPAAPTSISNLPFAADGSIVDARSKPTGAGFGVANLYQAARTVQINLRFSY